MIGQTDTDKRNGGPVGVLAESASHDAAAEIDRVAAERLIRTTVETIARGAAVKDVDGIVQRNLGNVSLADIRAGRLGSNVLGDIVNTVEQAKGNAAFNWNSATPEQIKAYLAANGMMPQGLMDGSRRMAQGDGSGRSSGSEARGTAAEINFAGSSLAKMGLTIDTFNAMQKEGFDTTQIKAAVRANNSLGLEANDNPAATARLQRDTPWAVKSLQGSHDALKKAHDLDRKAKDAEARGDTAAADRCRQQATTIRQGEQERHHHTQDRMRRERPERLPDYNDRYQRMNDAIEGLSHGDPQQEKANRAAIENYRRNPNDAAASRQYEDLKKKASADPRTRLAMQTIDKALHRGQKAEVAEAKRNEAKIAEIDQKELRNDDKQRQLADTKREDDVLAAMYSAASSKTASSETPAVQPEAHLEPKPVKTASSEEGSSNEASSKNDPAKKAETKSGPTTTSKPAATNQKTRLAGSLNPMA